MAISLLKFADSLVSGSSFHVTLSTNDDIWGHPLGSTTCYLAWLFPPLWHFGGPASDPAALRSTRMETLGSRLGFLSFLGGFQDHILIVFRILEQETCFLLCVFAGHVFLRLSGSVSGCLGL